MPELTPSPLLASEPDPNHDYAALVSGGEAQMTSAWTPPPVPAAAPPPAPAVPVLGDVTGLGDAVELGGGVRIPAHHPDLEVLAHGLAYKSPDEYTAEERAWLAESCYLPGPSLDDPDSDFQASLWGVDTARPECRGTAPVLAFRGSESLDDGVADLDPDGVGEPQYLANQLAIQRLIRAAGAPPILTGHSLGGALAQRAAVSNAHSISEVVTFQAPGIDTRQAGYFDAAHGRLGDEDEIPVTHYVGQDDPVSNAGESALDGRVIEINTPATIEHTQMLLQDSSQRTGVHRRGSHPCDDELDRSTTELVRQVAGNAGQAVADTAAFLNPWHQGGQVWQEHRSDDIIAHAEDVEREEFKRRKGAELLARYGGRGELTWIDD